MPYKTYTVDPHIKARLDNRRVVMLLAQKKDELMKELAKKMHARVKELEKVYPALDDWILATYVAEEEKLDDLCAQCDRERVRSKKSCTDFEHECVAVYGHFDKPKDGEDGEEIEIMVEEKTKEDKEVSVSE